MKDIVFIQSCPIDKYYLFQTNLWLESLKNIGKSDKAVSVIFVPKGRNEEVDNWNKLISLYPEAKFEFIEDEDNINNLIGIYIPILRPYSLMKYWKKHPELKEKAIFYCDNDIFFLSNFNIDKFIDDDICYLSDTRSYISAKYFDSKIKDVTQSRLEDYKRIDVLNEICKLSGITREIAEKNEENSGGAQYLLKNIDWKFWDSVITTTIRIRRSLQDINNKFFETESKGFQSWASDMWGVLHQLWYRGYETRIIKELDFAWSTDRIEKLKEVGIFHNAGATSEKLGEIPIFYKGKYHQGLDPFKDPKVEEIYNNEQNKTLANNFYVGELLRIKKKYYS